MASQTGPSLDRASLPHNVCSKTHLTCRTPAQTHHRTPASCACIVTLLKQNLAGSVCDEGIAILTGTGLQHATRAVCCLLAASKAEHDASRSGQDKFVRLPSSAPKHQTQALSPADVALPRAQAAPQQAVSRGIQTQLASKFIAQCAGLVMHTLAASKFHSQLQRRLNHERERSRMALGRL